MFYRGLERMLFSISVNIPQNFCTPVCTYHNTSYFFLLFLLHDLDKRKELWLQLFGVASVTVKDV